MKTKILILALILLFLVSATSNAQEIKSIQDLFNALKTHPQTKSDVLAFEKAKTGKQLAYSNLFPTITAYSSFDNYSDPAALLPVTPNGSSYMVQHQEIPQPFSDQIFKVGVSISMPVFIKSIYTTASKAKHMQKSAKAKKHINLLQNEAIIVSSNANLNYLDGLTRALESKKQSLLKTKEIIELKVKNGRAPGSSLLIINNGVNQVEASKNEIAINREQAISAIESLTGIRVSKPIQMLETNTIDNSVIKSLEPLQQKILADKLAYRAEKEKLLPSIMLRGSYTYSSGDAYNNNLSINTDFSTIGLVVSMPIFNKNQLTQIKKSKITYNATKNEFDKLKLTLKSQANQLENSLQLLYKSEKLYQQNIKDKEEILNIAKESYKSGRIAIEDYLKYEDDLVLEKSKLYKAAAEKWQTLVKLAVIYGNNIENLVK
ncbi:TolC family protein [Lutibacter sp.]|uniref:TolC family protein n=1 Tax=Lutibacter sp. TaxID=1925666 RepID=UPI0025C1C3AB|nr:TolC family protein [Lutibacter sp.]MCF6181225.1 TolC family protein [Lutibacter sp.]